MPGYIPEYTLVITGYIPAYILGVPGYIPNYTLGILGYIPEYTLACSKKRGRTVLQVFRMFPAFMCAQLRLHMSKVYCTSMHS